MKRALAYVALLLLGAFAQSGTAYMHTAAGATIRELAMV
jgi:hypothetical protein